jgi:hypothetical protein
MTPRRTPELTIRCHPCVPVDAGELESWLERQLGELRAATPDAIIRLSRLTQALPDSEITIGWLIEIERRAGDAPLAGERLGEALRDMRLLGLQPKVLTRPTGSGAVSSVRRGRRAYGSTSPRLIA